MIENSSIQNERKRTAEQYERGREDGYAQVTAPLPGWWYTHPPAQMTAYQRGWFTGRELAMEEVTTP